MQYDLRSSSCFSETFGCCVAAVRVLRSCLMHDLSSERSCVTAARVLRPCAMRDLSSKRGCVTLFLSNALE